MGFSTWLLLAITHPLEFRTLLQFRLYYDKNRDITNPREHATSGWDRESMRRCWGLLDLTSRSFSTVIKELDGDLARTICLFYLVLRGLDTIEDDMTIPDERKQKLLRNFHNSTVEQGWNFDGCGPNEKDRQLLVEYDVVVDEVNALDPAYKDVIIDICLKMENGMADYTHKAAVNNNSVYLDTIEEYDLYCHYVAGLVGEGLSRIFSASKKEAPWLAKQLELSNSMGLLLQKTNIIRDFREDCDEARFFWPREIWGAHGFSDMPDMRMGPGIDVKPGVKQRALWVQSAMILDAMRHLVDSLDYLRVLKTQTVFNFCAIPVTMAIATLELCFMNPLMFERNIKIRKAEAASLIMRSSNPREVAYIFREYCRKIHAKASYKDPSFLAMSVVCGQVEQWCEHHYPSFVEVITTHGSSKHSLNAADPRGQIVKMETEKESNINKAKIMKDIRAGVRDTTVQNNGVPWELFVYMGLVILLIIALSFGVIYTVLYFFPE